MNEYIFRLILSYARLVLMIILSLAAVSGLRYFWDRLRTMNIIDRLEEALPPMPPMPFLIWGVDTPCDDVEVTNSGIRNGTFCFVFLCFTGKYFGQFFSYSFTVDQGSYSG